MSKRTRPLVSLRAGEPGDLATINAIMSGAFDPRFGEAWTPAQCAGMLSLPGIWLTIASVDGEDIGFALARSTLDDGELLLIAVRDDIRRCGVGATLLRAVIRAAAERGVANLHLEVRKANPAISLYVNAGFRKIGERKNYYRGISGEHFDAQTFRLIISRE